MTTYEYDEAGLLIRSVTVREPEYSEWDVALLLQDRARRLARRGSHGLLLDETTEAKNQFAYKAKAPIIDWAEKALREAKQDYAKKYPKADMGALLWEVETLSPVSGEEELGTPEG